MTKFTKLGLIALSHKVTDAIHKPSQTLSEQQILEVSSCKSPPL